ncbi:hypothetical protein D9M71_566980 [compost metagenome]
MLPPIVWSKKLPPNIRSNNIINKPIVNGGNANKIKALDTRAVQVNNGIRINVIPGARIVIIVTIKLRPEINVPAPEICKPRT